MLRLHCCESIGNIRRSIGQDARTDILKNIIKKYWELVKL